jgi:predicted O-methyltransferase YrrM
MRELLATHRAVCISEGIALSKLQSTRSQFRNLASACPDLASTLSTAGGNDWEAAVNAHVKSTRPFDGSEPVGGVNPGDQRAIFSLIRQFRPTSVLEVGTHLGYSTNHIALALAANLECGASSAQIVSVDVRDVNDAADAPWRIAGAPMSPRDSVAALAPSVTAEFVKEDSVTFLARTEKKFDFVFLDGDHAAPRVYQELQLLERILSAGANVLLHDYFPGGKALWGGSLPCTGPWRAITRMQSEGAPLDVTPLGALPWPTKLGSHRTSLALLSLRPG